MGDEPFLDEANAAIEMLVGLGRVLPGDLWVDELVAARQREKFRALE